MLKINHTKKYMIIDLSYMLYYKFSSTFTRYTYAFNSLPWDKTNIHKYDFSMDEEYIRFLEQSLYKTFNDLISKHKVRWENIILAKDCRRKNIWRKEIFKEYKENRDKTEEDQLGQPNYGSVFGYCYDNILPILCESKGCKLIEQNGCEGDDIIAILSDYISNQNNSEIIICANDSDLSQLVNNGSKIWDLKGQRVDEKVINKYGGDSKNILKVKVLAGDKKDNVDQAIKRCGIGTALKLLDNSDLLKEKIKEDPSIVEKMKLNKRLLDLRAQPDILKENVIEKYVNSCIKL